ncbi:hypothetical protein C3744_27720 [Priestia megaterium]|uniref:Phage tail tape measure protein n=1 Tax=Priestia megaterium TaxID=1404 RepID=A0A3D8WUF2_PRIMG|nr:hypothetical protein [Priestia megaterium]MDH3173342.1 hypothetical protein [Priestia megaterium]RDZ07195.1 hypothetical protein C3744_27720 [Priestia megaterium]
MAYELTAVLSLKDELSKKMKSAIKSIGAAQKATDTYRDANGRLRDSMGRFAKANHGASSSLSGFTSHTGSAIQAVGALSAGVLTAAGAYKTLQATIGEAMKMEQSQVVIDAMFDDKKLSKQYQNMMNSFAIKSPVLDSSEMFANSKSFISQSKDVKQLEKMWNLTERLVAVDPKQGVEGAVLAMKELMSGDSQSMVERFEMPRKALNDIKNLPLNEQLAALDKLYNKMGMTNKLVTSMGSTSLGYINQIKEALAGKFRAVGFEALKSLKPIIVDIKNAVSEGALDGFFNSMGRAFAFLGSEASKFANYIKTNWPTIKANFQSTQSLLQPVGDALKWMYDKAKNAGDYIIQNWPAVQTTVLSLAAGFATLKAGLAIAGAVNTLTKAWALYRAGATAAAIAQLGLNAAMLMSPTTWVIAGIAALVAIGVVLYRNFDTIKAKAISLWNSMGVLRSILTNLPGPFGQVISAGIRIMSNWDSIRSKASSVFGAVGDFIDGVKAKFNGFVSAVKSFKMPSFKMPSMASTKAGMGPSKKDKSSYHGESYVPRNGMMYRLHQGERVLTKKENRQFAKGSGQSVVINMGGMTVREEADLDKIASKLARRIYLAGEAGA